MVSDEQAAFLGTWRITWMAAWEIEDVELVGPALMEFHRDRTGSFQFIAVEGWMDCRFDTCGGRPCVNFTWSGGDDGDPVNGRGRAQVEDDGQLRGHIYIHLGEDSAFRAITE